MATGSIDGREIKNNAVGTRDLRNGGVRSADLQNAGVTGADLRRGAVTLAATVDVAPGSAEQTVLAIPGLGRLVVQANGCEVTPPRAFDFAWHNEDNADQDVWARLADTDDPALPPQYALVTPNTPFTVSLNEGEVVAATLRIRPTDTAASSVTIELFADTAVTTNACRASAQALISS